MVQRRVHSILFDEVLEYHSVELITHTEVQKIVKNGEYFDVIIPGGGSVQSRFVVVTIGRMGKPNKPTTRFQPP